MQNALIVISVIISVLLIIVVLIQKSKGGGLASNFAGSNQLMGVRRTNNFIEKATWTLAIVVCVLSLLSGILYRSNSHTAIQPRVTGTELVNQFPDSFNTEAGDPTHANGEEGVVEEVEANGAMTPVEEAPAAPAPEN